MLAYDIDGTLAGTNFNNINSKAQLLGMYEKAKVIYQPKEPFIAVTARGTDPDIEAATRKWLKENQPNCKAVYFVGGSEEEKITGKARIVKRENADGYVDSKLTTLALFDKFGVTGIKLYHLSLSTKRISLVKEL